MTIRLANTPDYRLTIDGKDLTARLRPRLVSLTIADKREEADQLDIVLDDSDGRLALPPEGARITVEIGWKAGPDVEVGLVSKGEFKVDDVSHSGPPDKITIRARSADFSKASDLRTRRSHSWSKTTLGAVIRDIATRQKLEPRIASDLASVAVAAVHQSRESDAALLRRLGREHNAVSAIKAGKLVFTRIGSGKSASGQDLPALIFTRRDGDTHNYQRTKREESAGVTATYRDRATAKNEKVVAGEEKGARRLARVYPNKAAAQRAAEAAKGRSARQPASMSVKAALGIASVYAEQKATVSGYKPPIDATAWLVSEVTHSLSNDGFTTDMKLEPVG